MVNQNPQPEVYTTRHSFAAADTQGTVVTTQINTNQAYNEEIRIYGVMVNMYTNTAAASGDTVFHLINLMQDLSIINLIRHCTFRPPYWYYIGNL